VSWYAYHSSDSLSLETKASLSPQKMHGRFFSGRRVEATLFNGQQRFKRSGAGDDVGDEATEEAEKKRLDEFANWLMTEGD
jgi:HIV Tat-specific factor 1